MKQHVIKLSIVAIEVIGVLVAVAAAVLGYLFWRLENGPLRFDFLKPVAVSVLEQPLPEGYHSAIDDIFIAKDKTDGAYRIVLENIYIVDNAARPVFTLNSAVMSFAVRDLLAFRLEPRRIALDQPTLDIVRDQSRRVRLDYGGGLKREKNAVAFILDSPYFNRSFERAVITNAEIRFSDEASGRHWAASGASGRLYKQDGDFFGLLNAEFEREAVTAEQQAGSQEKITQSQFQFDAAIDSQTGILKAALALSDAPLSDLLAMFYGERAAILAGPVTGAANIQIHRDGSVIESALNGEMNGGALNLGSISTKVEKIRLQTAFDPSQDAFEIGALQIASDALKADLEGTVFLQERAQVATPAKVQFAVKGSDIKIYENGLFPEPLSLETFAATGVYDVAARRLAIGDISASLFETNAQGRFVFERPRPKKGEDAPSPGIDIDVKVEGPLTRKQILSAWPESLGDAARQFVSERIVDARARNVRAVFNAPAGAMGKGSLSDDALKVSFDLYDAEVIYAPTMRHLTKAAGAAVLKSNSFFIQNVTGKVGPVAMSAGEVAIPILRPKGADAFFRFTADGDVGDILEILNAEPLAILRTTGLSPSSFDGKASLRMEIIRPNQRETPRESYRFSGKGKFDNLSVAGLFADADLTNGVGDISLKSDAMHIKAKANFSGAPINLDWRQQFYGQKDKLHARVSGIVNSSTGDVFGVPSRQFLRGDVAFKADVKGNIGAFNDITLNADFSDAVLMADAFYWMKPKGESANGRVRIQQKEGRTIVDDLTINGAGVDVKGAFSLSSAGKLERVSFKKLFLQNAVDVVLDVEPTENVGTTVSLTGSYLNARPFIEAFFDYAEASDGRGGKDQSKLDWGQGLHLVSRIDNLELRNGVLYKDAHVDFWRNESEITKFTLSGRAQSGAPLSVGLAHVDGEDGVDQTIEARTDDIGSLLSGFLDVNSVIGGQGVVNLFVHEHHDEDHSPHVHSDDGTTHKTPEFAGVLEARDMRVVGAPLLARVFSAGSFNGLSGLLNGEGIKVSQSFARFSYHDNVLTLKDLRAAGPSVGLSADGRIATQANGGVDLRGAVAPVYQVNSFLGKAPLIGDLFVNRDGEGVVAVNYAISGDPSELKVSVNPLSALTPGFLRRIFEPQENEPSLLHSSSRDTEEETIEETAE